MKKKNRETEIVVRTERYIIEHKDETKEPKIFKVKRFFRVMPLLIYHALYGSVLHCFKSLNRKAGSKLPFWRMKSETFRHVSLLIKMLKWVVLPASLLYVCAAFYFFRRNALDSMLWGLLIFFYSNFLPDLPSIYNKKIFRDKSVTTEDLPWYKKYTLLLFAPLFIGAFFMGYRLGWKTTETFHNFRSLAIYVVFLFTLSLFAFRDYSSSIGDMTEILSLPAYGLIGYLTHLKVDLCF